MRKKTEEKDPIVKVNILKNRYVTDGNIWTIDETIFNENLYVFLVVNLKTRAILGYIIGHKPVRGEYIVELYKLILDNYPLKEHNPLIVHSDSETEYLTPEINQLFKEENIQTSVVIADQHQNQVSETINDKIKYYSILKLLEKPKRTKSYRSLVTSQPAEFKGKSSINKAKSKNYRKWFFNTEYFAKYDVQAIETGIITFNKKDFVKGITREEAEYYNTKVEGNSIGKLQLVKSTDDYANQIKRLNVEAIVEAKQSLSDIIQSKVPIDEKLVNIQALLLTRQNATNEIMIQGFTGIAAQNVELLDANKELKEQINFLQSQMKLLIQELDRARLEQQEKENRKKVRAKRKRLPKRDPITSEIYQSLIENVKGTGYCSARLRLAFLLLTITGIRVNELLPLKIEQLHTLIQSYWIAINRSKRGPSSHKAYLTRKGIKLVRQRQKDFEIIFAMKEPDAYIFTSDLDHYKKLRRETLTRDINKVTRQVSESLPNKPNITSHSFRIGYITELWKDFKDIEFVRQNIGHIKVESTSSYVENLTDEERQKRMLEVNSPSDLIQSKTSHFETEKI